MAGLKMSPFGHRYTWIINNCGTKYLSLSNEQIEQLWQQHVAHTGEFTVITQNHEEGWIVVRTHSVSTPEGRQKFLQVLENV